MHGAVLFGITLLKALCELSIRRLQFIGEARGGMVFRDRVNEPGEGLFEPIEARVDKFVHGSPRMQRTKEISLS